MDHDSGRGLQRSAPRRDGHARPEHHLDDQPPTGAVKPLPRRSAQEHMEPQLRRPGGSGTGAPFNPFNPFAVEDDADDGKARHDQADDPSEDGDEATVAAESTRAADFNKGSRRGRRTTPPAGAQ